MARKIIQIAISRGEEFDEIYALDDHGTIWKGFHTGLSSLGWRWRQVLRSEELKGETFDKK